MNQAKYIAFYDKVKGYAFVCAGDLFHDVALKEEAIDRAMDKLVDYMVNNPEPTFPYSRAIVHNSLVNTFKAISRVSNNRPLMARLGKITAPREKEIMRLYSRGMRQVDIAHKLRVSEPYVSKVVRRWAIG